MKRLSLRLGTARGMNGLWRQGAALLIACRQLLVGVTRLNSSSACLIFATSSDPSARIPVLLAEDTTHSRRANKKPDPPPGLCKDRAHEETLPVCARRAGERGEGCTAAYGPLGRHPGAAQRKIMGVLRSCTGRGVPSFLYNQGWKKHARFFFHQTVQSVVFSTPHSW